MPKLCPTCGSLIPRRAWITPKGLYVQECPSAYQARKYCSRMCRPERPRGSRLYRERLAVEGAEQRRAKINARPLTVPPPYGHICEICHTQVQVGHPLHAAARPDRASLIPVLDRFISTPFGVTTELGDCGAKEGNRVAEPGG